MDLAGIAHYALTAAAVNDARIASMPSVITSALVRYRAPLPPRARAWSRANASIRLITSWGSSTTWNPSRGDAGRGCGLFIDDDSIGVDEHEQRCGYKRLPVPQVAGDGADHRAEPFVNVRSRDGDPTRAKACFPHTVTYG